MKQIFFSKGWKTCLFVFTIGNLSIGFFTKWIGFDKRTTCGIGYITDFGFIKFIKGF